MCIKCQLNSSSREQRIFIEAIWNQFKRMPSKYEWSIYWKVNGLC